MSHITIFMSVEKLPLMRWEAYKLTKLQKWWYKLMPEQTKKKRKKERKEKKRKEKEKKRKEKKHQKRSVGIYTTPYASSFIFHISVKVSGLGFTQ